MQNNGSNTHVVLVVFPVSKYLWVYRSSASVSVNVD